MATLTKTKADELRSRGFWDNCCAEDVMSVIKHGLVSSVWRRDLMIVHLHLVYHFAHQENERIDFDIRYASLLKPELDTVAGRIVARRKEVAAEATL